MKKIFNSCRFLSTFYCVVFVLLVCALTPNESFCDEAEVFKQLINNAETQLNNPFLTAQEKATIFKRVNNEYLSGPSEVNELHTFELKNLFKKHLTMSAGERPLSDEEKRVIYNELAKDMDHVVRDLKLADADPDAIAERVLGTLFTTGLYNSVTNVQDLQAERKPVLVPNVKGLKIAEAVSIIERSHLQLRTKLIPTGDKEKASIVLSQDKAPDELVDRNTTITLNVYILDPDLMKISVPDVVGMPVSEAVTTLEKVGLKATLFIKDTPDKSEANFSRIVSQVPGQGRNVATGKEVDLVLFRFDPSSAPTACVTLKSQYKSAMVRKPPNFDRGREYLVMAHDLDCWFVDQADDHFEKTTASFEKATGEQAQEEKLCQELYQEYKEKMATKGKPVDFRRGRQIVNQAKRCDWYDRAKSHYAQSEEAYENQSAEQQQDECAELSNQFDRAIHAARESLNVADATAIFESAKNCTWASQQEKRLLCLDGEINAVKALNNGIIQNAKKWVSWGQNQNCAYSTQLSSMIDQTEKLNDQQELCSDLYEKYSNAVQAANKSLDLSEVKSIVASSENCSWYSNAEEMIPCMDGEFQGLSAYNIGDLETASHWARWGKSKRCSYTGRLFSLIQNEETARKQQQYCQQLGEQATLAAAQADKTLDASELKAIVSSAQGCSWYSKVSAMVPCMDGEYNALRAYNAGDLQNAASWTDWGRENNCTYVDRLAGLINAKAQNQQRVTQQETTSRETFQKETGFWETFGQELARGLEDYNRQMNAQMQQQTQQYLNQAIQQQFQKKAPTQSTYQQPLQQKSVSPAPPRSSQVNQPNTCAQLDSQLLAACNARNVPLGESLYEQAGRRGCNLSPATMRCIDQYIDEWFDNLENDLGKTFNQNTFRVK